MHATHTVIRPRIQKSDATINSLYSLKGLPLMDQRYLPRWETNVQAYYHANDAKVIFRTRVKDLNASGVCLYVGKDICVGQKLEVTIYLSPEKSFEAQGTVMWIYILPSSLSCAGIAFDNLPRETQDLILEYAFEVR